MFQAALLVVIVWTTGCQGQCPSGWKLTKKFDFPNNDRIRSEWDIQTWPAGKVNNEKQQYTADAKNVFARDGNLVLEAYKNGNSFTSGRVHSKQLFTPTQTPGKKLRIEYTGKVPTVAGAWPAYWLLGIESTYGVWPATGEIDVMEWVQSISGIYKGSLHFAGRDGKDVPNISRDFRLSAADMSTKFITYGVEWSAVRGDEYIQFYFRLPNGQVQNAQKFDKNTWASFQCRGGRKPGASRCSDLAPFDNKMNVIINLAVGGDWGGVGVTNYDAFNKGVEFVTKDVIVCSKN